MRIKRGLQRRAKDKTRLAKKGFGKTEAY